MTAPPTRSPARGPYSYTPPQDDTPKVVRRARIILTLVLIPLGLKAFGDEYGQVPLLSGINLAVHEFGHMLFQPFGIAILGETMVILGGSLTQVALPLIFVGYFLYTPQRERRDTHAAMICLWWSSINMLGVAIYAADARAGQLMLITGATGEDDPDSHDWKMLFSIWGVLNRDTIWAGRMRGVAFMMFFASIVVGLWAAIRSGEKQHPTNT